MNLEVVEKLIEMAKKHGVEKLSVTEGDLEVSVTTSSVQMSGQFPMMSQPMFAQHMQAQAAPAAPAAAAEAPAAPVANKNQKTILSPFVGTFYRAPSPDADVFVDVGQRVRKGDTLCIIEAMKLMNEIEAEYDGVVKEILVDNETPVEFEQPLFVIE